MFKVDVYPFLFRHGNGYVQRLLDEYEAIYKGNFEEMVNKVVLSIETPDSCKELIDQDTIGAFITAVQVQPNFAVSAFGKYILGSAEKALARHLNKILL